MISIIPLQPLTFSSDSQRCKLNTINVVFDGVHIRVFVKKEKRYDSIYYGCARHQPAAKAAASHVARSTAAAVELTRPV